MRTLHSTIAMGFVAAFVLGTPLRAQVTVGGTLSRIDVGVGVFDVTVFNDDVYFATGSRPATLHRFDGREAFEIGTIGRAGFHTGRNASIEYASIGDQLYLATDSIYRTDGIQIEPLQLSDGTPFQGGIFEHAGFFPFRGEVYFVGRTKTHGAEVFRTDGQGISIVGPLNPSGEAYGTYRRQPNFTQFEDQLLFTATTSAGGRMLTTRGEPPLPIGDLSPVRSDDLGVNPYAVYDGSFYFGVSQPISEASANGLYRYDGTQASRLSDVVPYNGFLEFDGQLFFAGYGPNGVEPYRTNGTEVVELMDINPEGDSLSYRSTFFPFAGELYFVAMGPDGNELYRTDGESVVQVADINRTGDAFPRDGFFSAHRPTAAYEHSFDNEAVIVFDGHLYFSAVGQQGIELYRTDGQTAELVADINPYGNSTPMSFAVVDNLLYFSARGTHGRELYRTDGTEVSRLTDINPGLLAANVLDGDHSPNGDSLYRDVPLSVLDGELYFPAFDADQNVDLYRFTPVPEPSAGALSVLAMASATLWIIRANAVRSFR